MAIGWTETYVKFLDSTVDINHEGSYRQRHRCASTLFMRSVDPNPQAQPLCKREDYRPSADALVSLQRDQSKGVPQIPLHLRTRQHDTLDAAVQQRLEWLSFTWQQHFSSSSTWTESSRWWSSQHWKDSQQWRESGNQKNGKINSGGTNGKNGQRQNHVQTSSEKPVGGEYCFDCCQGRPEFQFLFAVLRIHQPCGIFSLTDFATRQWQLP